LDSLFWGGKNHKDYGLSRGLEKHVYVCRRRAQKRGRLVNSRGTASYGRARQELSTIRGTGNIGREENFYKKHWQNLKSKFTAHSGGRVQNGVAQKNLRTIPQKPNHQDGCVVRYRE